MQALGLVILVLNWNKHASAMFQGSWLCTCFGQWFILLFGHWQTLQCYPPIFKSICQNMWMFEAGMGIPLISLNKGTGMSFGLPVNTVWVKVSFEGSLYHLTTAAAHAPLPFAFLTLYSSSKKNRDVLLDFPTGDQSLHFEVLWASLVSNSSRCVGLPANITFPLTGCCGSS